MSPLQIDVNEEQPKVEVIPSIIIEVVAFINILANREKYDFEPDFVNHFYGKLSSRSILFLKLISGMGFSGCDLFGFFMSEGIYTDFHLFVEKISGYSGVEFIYRALGREIPIERLEEAVNDRSGFKAFLEDISSCFWKGNTAPIEALMYDTENYKVSLIGLMKEIYKDSKFINRFEDLANVYRQSAEDIRKRLLNKSPDDLAKEIKGWSKSLKSAFGQYYFFPSYFLFHHNIASWYDDTFMLFYSAKFVEKVNNKEIDTVLSIFKSLSDRTRLQILQQLRSEPSYGKLLAEKMNLSGATISRHLDQLKSLNLIIEEKSDNYKYFKLNNEEIENVVGKIQTFLSSK